jgi:hypothetical protein
MALAYGPETVIEIEIGIEIERTPNHLKPGA